MSAQDDFRERSTVQISFADVYDRSDSTDAQSKSDYDAFPADGDKFVHEGRYVPDDMLPFRIADSAGTRFTMDGTKCELLGDLGGHAVYRRDRSKSTIRTMDWDDFVTAYKRGHIVIR